MSSANDEFHLAFTMAGAVSAGAYTAGVMDYMFEVLDAFERAKQGEFGNEIKAVTPEHRVTVDAMGGASAGGMVSVMAALYALRNEVHPVRSPHDPNKEVNLFYKSWIELDDNEMRSTLAGMLNVTDLEMQANSLLNSSFIDRIAMGTVPAPNVANPDERLREAIGALPSYIAPDMELLLSHTMLRGIPLQVRFDSEGGQGDTHVPYHTTYEHFMMSHYKFGGAEVNGSEYLRFNPFDKELASQLRTSTMATGAFPFGLLYREFREHHFTEPYIRTIIERILTRDMKGTSNHPELDLKFPDGLNDDLMTVDGGTVNNEPYSEVLSVMRSRSGAAGKDEQHDRFGVIMIDPFPDNVDENKAKRVNNVFDLIPRMYSTLRDQAKVKRPEMVDQFLRNDHYRGQVYPVKGILDQNGKRVRRHDHPLTCASLGAFGGFLDRRFREHDFFLGRNNARNFIRAYLSMVFQDDPRDRHPIHRDPRWNEGGVFFERFVCKQDPNDRSTWYLPILPDVNILLNEQTGSGAERDHYDIPEFPKYDPEELFKLKGSMETRVLRLIQLAQRQISLKGDPKRDVHISDLMDKHYRSTLRRRVIGFFVSLGLKGLANAAQKPLAKMAVRSIIAAILKDLKDRGILKEKNAQFIADNDLRT